MRAIAANPDAITILPSLQVDSATYDEIARDIAKTWSLSSVPPLQPPGFVATLAAVYTVAGPSWLAAKVFLWAMFVLCVFLSARVGRLVGRSELAAWVAGLLTASASALHFYVGTIQYEVLAAAWILGLVLAGDWTSRAESFSAALRRALLLGVMAGIAALTREVFVVCIPVLGLFVAHRGRDKLSLGRSLALALTVVSIAASMVTAWTGYQSARTSRVVTMTDKGPAVLAYGNNPNANGTFNAPAVGVGEPSGFAFMQAHPGATLRLAGRKVLYFWGILRDGWNVPRPGAVWVSRATSGLVPLEVTSALARGGAVAALFIIALAHWRRETWTRWWVLPALIIAVMSVHVVTVSSHRFAVPILPLTFICIAGPAASVVLQSLGRPPLLIAAGALLVVTLAMQSVRWPLSYTLHAAEMDGLNVANLVDADRGPIRFAQADRGPRTVVLLSDEYLPRGRFTITVDMRQRTASAGVVARIWMRTADGRPLCELDVTAAPGVIGHWQQITLPCASATDHVSTFAVDATGAADFDVATVVLEWRDF